MKKRIMKKSEVLREGYIKGLKEAQKVINETLFGYGLVEDGRYTINEMGARITQDLIDDLEKVKTAFENEENAHNITSDWSSVVYGYDHLRGYMKKVFGLR